MTSLGQFRVPREAARRQLAGTLRRATGGSTSAGTPLDSRQAKVISVDGGSPATLTIRFDPDAVTPVDCAGVRYLASYTPGVGHVVEILFRGGDPFVLGRLAP